MDTLFIGDIPEEYHFALFNNGYIDLYNTEQLNNGTYTFYRIYTNCGGFYYKQLSTSYNQYNTTFAQNISVTNDVCFRQDFDKICVITFIICIFRYILI